MSTNATSLQDQFLAAMLEGDRTKFRELLGHPAVNPTHKYGKPHYSTCLEIACRRRIHQDFIRALLTKVKPNINQIVPEPIHFAAGKGNAEALDILLNDKRTKVNAEDSAGRTALHHAAKNFDEGEESERYERCIALLLTHTNLDVNRKNKKGCTAVYEAAHFGGKKAVQAMMKFGKEDLDLDIPCRVGKTARVIIVEKFPELKGILPRPKRDTVHPTESRCQLLIAIQNGKLDRFRSLLQQVDTDGNVLTDPNEWCGKPYNTTCLEMACREEGCEEFIKAVLQAGADPNTVNLISEQSPIHVTADAGNVKALTILLEDRRTNVNAVDGNGRTALHCAVNQKEAGNNILNCISLLLRQKHINVNIEDNMGHKPIETAIYHGNETIVKTFLEKNTHPLQEGKTKAIRDIILENFPALKNCLPQGQVGLREEPDMRLELVQQLHKKQIDEFITTLTKRVPTERRTHYANCNDGSLTFLQYACRHGLYDVANVLLNHQADPNLIPKSKWPPVVLACYHRHHDILNLFLNLEAESKFDINGTDMKGNTALHYAAKYEDFDCVLALLSHGADIRLKNVFDKPPLPPKSAQALLDKCLCADGDHYPDEDEYKLMFNYGLLVPHIPESRNGSNVNRTGADIVNCTNEMKFLFYLAESNDHMSLLKHPIITSFLALKWHRIKTIFYFNVILYLLFFISLNLYIILDPRVTGKDISGSDSENLERSVMDHFTAISVVIFLCLLLFRECIQLLISPKQYLHNPENYLNLSLVIFTCCGLYLRFENGDIQNTFVVVTLMLSWAELILLTGRFPTFSKNIEMLKKVFKTFLWFMSWYSMLIIGFAVTFHVMFRNCKDSSHRFFSIREAMIKTVVMMTGEFNSHDSIPFDEAPTIVSQIVFVLFVFLVAIVLLNLLTGLAVSDTQAIQNDAQLYSIISHIWLVFELESLLLEWHRAISTVSVLRPFRLDGWINFITLFPPSVPNTHLCVMPNKGTHIMSPHDESSLISKIDMDTLGAAMNIIGKQNKTSEIEHINKRLNDIETQLQKFG